MKATLETVTGVTINRDIDTADSPMGIIRKFYEQCRIESVPWNLSVPRCFKEHKDCGRYGRCRYLCYYNIFLCYWFDLQVYSYSDRL